MTFLDTSYPIRSDISEILDTILAHLTSPGTWFDGAERAAIALEARNATGCAHCAACKAALSPYSVAGAHDATQDVSEPVLDAVHRIVNDPGRLTEKWYLGLVDEGLQPEEYVEIIGIVAHVTALDTFAHGLGVAIPDLPDVTPGEATQERVSEAKVQMAWVPTVGRKDASGALRDEWYPGGDPRFIPHVVQAMSAVPREAISFKHVSGAMYLDPTGLNDPTYRRDTLTRPQMELVASRVSALNDCFY